jgi:hypothetical protein
LRSHANVAGSMGDWPRRGNAMMCMCLPWFQPSLRDA